MVQVSETMTVQDKLDFYRDLVAREKQHPGGYAVRRSDLVRVLWAEYHPLNPYPEVLPAGAEQEYTVEQLGQVWFPVAAGEAGLTDEEIQLVKPAVGDVVYRTDGPVFSLPWRYTKTVAHISGDSDEEVLVTDFADVPTTVFSFHPTDSDERYWELPDYAQAWRALDPYERWQHPRPYGGNYGELEKALPVGQSYDWNGGWYTLGSLTDDKGRTRLYPFDPGLFFGIPSSEVRYWDYVDDYDGPDRRAIGCSMMKAISRLMACLAMDSHPDMPELIEYDVPGGKYVAFKARADVEKFLRLAKSAAVVVNEGWRLPVNEDGEFGGEGFNSTPDGNDLTWLDKNLPDLIEKTLERGVGDYLFYFSGYLVSEVMQETWQQYRENRNQLRAIVVSEQDNGLTFQFPDGRFVTLTKSENGGYSLTHGGAEGSLNTVNPVELYEAARVTGFGNWFETGQKWSDSEQDLVPDPTQDGRFVDFFHMARGLNAPDAWKTLNDSSIKWLLDQTKETFGDYVQPHNLLAGNFGYQASWVQWAEMANRYNYAWLAQGYEAVKRYQATGKWDANDPWPRPGRTIRIAADGSEQEKWAYPNPTEARKALQLLHDVVEYTYYRELDAQVVKPIGNVIPQFYLVEMLYDLDNTTDDEVMGYVTAWEPEPDRASSHNKKLQPENNIPLDAVRVEVTDSRLKVAKDTKVTGAKQMWTATYPDGDDTRTVIADTKCEAVAKAAANMSLADWHRDSGWRLRVTNCRR